MSFPQSAIHPPNNSASAPFVYEILSAEASFFSYDSHAETNANPVCDGDKFGESLIFDSCTEAWRGISVDTDSLRLSQRGFGPYDVQLPHRRSSSDGTCVIDIFHKDGAVSDIATGQDLSRAAMRVINACVFNDKGGYLSDLGLDKNLIVVVSLYKPAVVCLGSARQTREHSVGQELLDMLPVSLDYLVFGLSGTPGVQQVVPDVFTPEATQQDSFEAVVDIDRYTVMGRWFDLWAGAHAVDAICVGRQGRSGSSVSRGGLKITLDRVNEVSANNVTATS